MRHVVAGACKNLQYIHFTVMTLHVQLTYLSQCSCIKRNARFANTPVVMLSSKDGVFDKARGRMVGCQDYLTKPFTKDQLLQAVQQYGNLDQGAM